MLTRDDLEALGADLMAADDAADPQKVAAIAWQLYSEAGVEQADIERLHAALRFRAQAPGGDHLTTTPCEKSPLGRLWGVKTVSPALTWFFRLFARIR